MFVVFCICVEERKWKDAESRIRSELANWELMEFDGWSRNDGNDGSDGNEGNDLLFGLVQYVWLR